MIPPAVHQRFAAVLKAEQLAEIPTSFCDPAFYDEVPLYSRYEQIDFLHEYGDVDRLLMGLALAYLERVKSECAPKGLKRFIAVTVIRDDVSENTVPYIFICNSNPSTRLKELRPAPPSKGLGQYVQNLVEEIDSGKTYSVLEDRSTVSDDVRVFVSYQSPPRGLIGLDAFTNRANLP
jgi:hypothetical protein